MGMNLFTLYGLRASDSAGHVSAEHAASRAESKARSVEQKLRRLEDNLAKALMINEALWEIVRDRHGLSEKDLYEKLYEVDMRDGELDGKNQRKAAACPNCGHMVSGRHSACIYCGQAM